MIVVRRALSGGQAACGGFRRCAHYHPAPSGQPCLRPTIPVLAIISAARLFPLYATSGTRTGMNATPMSILACPNRPGGVIAFFAVERRWYEVSVPGLSGRGESGRPARI